MRRHEAQPRPVPSAPGNPLLGSTNSHIELAWHSTALSLPSTHHLIGGRPWFDLSVVYDKTEGGGMLLDGLDGPQLSLELSCDE